jgi:hypothetical protein
MPKKLRPAVDLMAFKCRTVKVKRRGISLNLSAYGLFFYLYDEEQNAPKRRYLLHEIAAKFSGQSDSNEMSTKYDLASRLNSYNLSFKGVKFPGRRAKFCKVTPNI